MKPYFTGPWQIFHRAVYFADHTHSITWRRPLREHPLDLHTRCHDACCRFHSGLHLYFNSANGRVWVS